MTRCLSLVLLVLAAGCGDKQSAPRSGGARLAPVQAATPSATVTITGSVIDRDTRETVGDVEVVLRGEHGDVAARTAANGVFKLAVARGTYRAFVRDARVITTGLQGRIRLRTLPRAALAGAPDEALMPLLEITDDTSGIELSVVAAAVINGIVSNPDGEPVEGVVIHADSLESVTATSARPTIVARSAARDALRPALGTDTVISDAEGKFVLRVPAGSYELVANHPDFAGVGGIAEFELDAGARIDALLTLQRGCIVTGRVVGVGGAVPHDGAIEMQTSLGGSFGPSGRVNPDGTFRWTTTESGTVFLRAWPWMSAPSRPRELDCRDGKRFTDVVLQVGNDLPDIAGTIVDARGDRIPLAYLDIAPLDFAVGGQQERGNANGEWHVYQMPPGRYQITAHAPGRGVVSTTVVAPRRDLMLQLSGSGRLAGTTTELVDGSFEIVFHHCGPANNPIALEDDARIVVVRGGRFSIDGVPACALTFAAHWRDRVVTQGVVVEPDGTAYVELDLGVPREKTISGTVRDTDGNTVANARVTVLVDRREATSVRADDDGRFTLKTQSGAQLVAGNGKRVGRASVGRANVATEQVDLVLNDVE